MSPHIRLRDVVKSLTSGVTVSEMIPVLNMRSIEFLLTRHTSGLPVFTYPGRL